MSRDSCCCSCDGCVAGRAEWKALLFGHDRRQRSRKERRGKGHCGRAYKGCQK